MPAQAPAPPQPPQHLSLGLSLRFPVTFVAVGSGTPALGDLEAMTHGDQTGGGWREQECGDLREPGAQGPSVLESSL